MENIQSNAAFDDVIFKDRNKGYGAYQLRKDYTRNFAIAMGISIVLFTFATFIPDIVGFFSNLMGRAAENEKIDKEVVVELIDVPLDPEVPEPPKIEVEPPKVEMIRFLPPEPKPDEEVTRVEIPPTQDELEDKANIGSANQEGDSNLTIIDDPGNGNKIVEVEEEDILYTAVQEPAEFPGGPTAMAKFLYKNIVYPKKARDNGETGKVHIYFEVDKAGKVVNARVMKGFNEACDQEALRVVKSFPDWKPAKQNGRPARVRMVVPIAFTLDE